MLLVIKKKVKEKRRKIIQCKFPSSQAIKIKKNIKVQTQRQLKIRNMVLPNNNDASPSPTRKDKDMVVPIIIIMKLRNPNRVRKKGKRTGPESRQLKKACKQKPEITKNPRKPSQSWRRTPGLQNQKRKKKKKDSPANQPHESSKEDPLLSFKPQKAKLRTPRTPNSKLRTPELQRTPKEK